MNNRPKISSLSKMELAQLLGNLFFLTGKDVNLTENETDLLLDNIYKYHGGKFIDDFSDAFSKYSAGELLDAEALRPQVSPRFVSMLMKVYFNKHNDNIINKNRKINKPTVLTSEDKYMLFVQFVKANKSLPGNCDWVMIFEHLTGLNKLLLPRDWATLTYYRKWKHAMEAVTAWAYNSFTITDILLSGNFENNSVTKGIGTRLGETIWNGVALMSSNDKINESRITMSDKL